MTGVEWGLDRRSRACYAPPIEASFTGVPPQYWAYRHVEYCREHGVVNGYWGGYHPEDTVTRDQMAVYVQCAFRLAM